ncbi:MAG: FAD-dependent monooxygenase [Roseiarcus sp.]
MDRLIVAGGGIGGVAAALALARKNISTIVLEQAPELGEIGPGIQIAPNAFHCFDRLGVGDRARSEAVYVDRLRLMDGLSGEEIVHIPLDAAFRERFRNPYAVVHRADLHLALLEAAKKSGLVEIRTDHRVERYDRTGHP